MRLLIIDHNQWMRRLLHSLLRGLDVCICESRTQAEALVLIGPFAPDLVLLEGGLFGHDGMDCLSRIRAAHPDVPVIVVTDFRDGAVEAELRSLGARLTLQKDGLHELREVLTDAFRTRIAGSTELPPQEKNTIPD